MGHELLGGNAGCRGYFYWTIFRREVGSGSHISLSIIFGYVSFPSTLMRLAGTKPFLTMSFQQIAFYLRFFYTRYPVELPIRVVVIQLRNTKVGIITDKTHK